MRLAEVFSKLFDFFSMSGSGHLDWKEKCSKNVKELFKEKQEEGSEIFRLEKELIASKWPSSGGEWVSLNKQTHAENKQEKRINKERIN